MESSSITLTEALTELRDLRSRIKALTASFQPFAIRKASRFVGKDLSQNEADFTYEANHDWNSIRELMTRYRTLKLAIVRVNHTTNLSVAGQEMTIAEAVDLKKDADYFSISRVSIRDKFETALRGAKYRVTSNNEDIDQKLSDITTNSLRNSNNDCSKFEKQFRDSHYAVLFDPLGVEKSLLPQLQDQHYNFHIYGFLERSLAIADAKTIVSIPAPLAPKRSGSTVTASSEIAQAGEPA